MWYTEVAWCSICWERSPIKRKELHIKASKTETTSIQEPKETIRSTSKSQSPHEKAKAKQARQQTSTKSNASKIEKTKRAKNTKQEVTKWSSTNPDTCLGESIQNHLEEIETEIRVWELSKAQRQETICSSATVS